MPALVPKLISLEEQDWLTLKSIAEEKNTSRAKQVREAVKEFISKQRARSKK